LCGDENGHRQPEAANLIEERRAALTLHFSLEDQRRNVGVFLHPAQGGRERPGPRHLDVRCDVAERVCRELCCAAFVGDVKDFHRAR
jgi:hypothetical protein